MISFEAFKELEIKIVKVTGAERIPGSDKLIKIAVNAGSESRTIIAGIGKKYDPECLIGREVAIVANLEPKKFTIKSDFGENEFESQGMLLAANDGGPVLLMPDREVPPGSIVS